MERHHKIIIGGVSSFVIIVLVLNSIFLYTLFVKLNVGQNSLEEEISTLKADINSKVTELTQNVIENKNSLLKLDQSFTNLDQSLSNELKELKASASSDFSAIIEEVIPSVVTIRTDIGQGTGFAISSDGYIVTNAHVLAGGKSVTILTSSQEEISAKLIGYHGVLDIALLKVSHTFNPLKLANSNEVQVGEKVIAIGNPLGLQFSVSEGIVSAINRKGDNGLEAYIQTDAALNPGNSGGPLIDKEGEVIGINNFKVGDGESLGFALESEYIKEVVNDISSKAFNQTLLN